MKLERYFTKEGLDVYDMFDWQYVDVHIENFSNGQIIFDAKNLEFPAHYNRNACDIIAKMYFVKKGVPETDHEVTMKQVVSRMANFWGLALVDEGVIFKKDFNIFFDEIRYIMLKQLWAPNTPQWFNTGLFHSYGINKEGNGSFYYDEKLGRVVEAKSAYERTPASACFITRVEDSLFGEESLSDHLTTATRLFSYGSGIGTNWSNVRGEGEALSPGGVSSGVLSFIKVFDSNAGAIKSGGAHRRSSVMNVLDLDHPDVLNFIKWKSEEEDKVRALGKMGYSTSMNGAAYETVSGQNCNNSVSIPDSFMKLLDVPGAKWKLTGRVDHSKDREVLVKDLWHAICKAAWECGDPGVQFTDHMNKWNTVKNSGRIRGSNPCFTYDTKILTDDGYKPIGSLCGRKFNLINYKGNIVEGKVWKSGEKETIELVLSDNTKIHCTPDHPIMLSDGTTALAKDTLGKRLKSYTGFANIKIDDLAYKAGLEVDIDNIQAMAIIEKLCGLKNGLYYGESDRKIRSFIKGVFDKKGYFSDTGISIESTTKSVEIIAHYLSAHGIRGYISTFTNLTGIGYRLNIIDIHSLMNFHGNIGFRDGLGMVNMLNFATGLKVTKIIQSTTEEVYDFMEPETHFGVVEGIVVHNCSEFLFLDDSACNLSSINLVPFLKDGNFDFKSYREVVKLGILVMEASVHWGCYPTTQIAENSWKFRPLGLGYTNLGALLMKLGLPYDSTEGRDLAAFLMNTLTAEAYHTSALIAQNVGPFKEFGFNKQPMLEVISEHAKQMSRFYLQDSYVHNNIPGAVDDIKQLWDDTIELGRIYGYKNAQVSLLAPTGCVNQGTMIPTSYGMMQLGRIGDTLSENTWQDIDYEVASDSGLRKANKFHINAMENVVTIKTSSGNSITGTPAHRIKVLNDVGQFVWKRFSDIKRGDIVPSLMGTIYGGSHKIYVSDTNSIKAVEVDVELAELLGVFANKGEFCQNGEFVFSLDKENKEIEDRIYNFFQRKWDVEVSKQTLSGVNYHIKSEWMGKIWKSLWDNNIINKKVPNAIFASNDERIYKAFIRGFFETSHIGEFAIIVNAGRFAQQIYLMLLALGIHSNIEEKDGMNQVGIISEYYVDKYLKEIGFLSDSLNKLYGEKSADVYINDKVYLTKSLYNKIADVMKENVLEIPYDITEEYIIPHEYRISREYIDEYIDMLPNSLKSELKERCYFAYDSVFEVTLSENPEPTYDISVPNGNTYIANGFISHNTISFAMNCESTGLEPFFSNIVYKKVADGSFMSMTNECIRDGLKALHYSDSDIEDIMKYVEENHGMVEGAPHLKEEHFSVFDTASKNGNGTRYISPMAHVLMLSSLQPNMSASASKTTNVPNETTIEEIEEIYRNAWEFGVKCVALYRDGCKAAQPLSTKLDDPNAIKPLEEYSYAELLDYAKNQPNETVSVPVIESVSEAKRERLPFEPKCIKNEIQMDDQTFHIIRSFYDDGRLGEIFVTVGKNGSTVKGLQEVLCMIISKALQYGVPAEVLAKTMRHHEFSPNGFVYNHPNIKSASSIPDLMSKFLDISIGNYQYCQVKPTEDEKKDLKDIKKPTIDGLKFEPVYGERCTECGSTKLVKAGVCKYCQSCGNSTGCS